MNSGGYAVIIALAVWAMWGPKAAVLFLVSFFVGYFMCAFKIGREKIEKVPT